MTATGTDHRKARSMAEVKSWAAPSTLPYLAMSARCITRSWSKKHGTEDGGTDGTPRVRKKVMADVPTPMSCMEMAFCTAMISVLHEQAEPGADHEHHGGQYQSARVDLDQRHEGHADGHDGSAHDHENLVPAVLGDQQARGDRGEEQAHQQWQEPQA